MTVSPCLIWLCFVGILFGKPDAAPGRYIVRLAESRGPVLPEQAALAAERATGGKRGHLFTHVFEGYTIELPVNVSADRLRRLPGVLTVEPDVKVYLCAQTTPTGVRRINAHRSPIADIDGIDQRVDVGVAVIDTGIDSSHPDLNVVGGRRFIGVLPPNSWVDTDGHGTHVAGIIAAMDNDFGVVGVAPGAQLWALKVLENNETGAFTSDIIRALDWVAQNSNKIQVVNMSLGGVGYNSSLHTAVKNVVARGVVICAAAGNTRVDIYGADGTFGTDDDIFPASFPEVAAISALADKDGKPGGLGSSTGYGVDDSFATFSNFSRSVVADNPVNSFGGAIDLMMPGTRIYSTNLGGTYSEKSGTSMSCPHAVGLAALYIAAHGRATDAAGVYAIRQALINRSSFQTSPRGLKTLNDTDGFQEKLGYIVPADINGDGLVDAADFVAMSTAWMTTPSDAAYDARCNIALPADGVIDSLDLMAFVEDWLVGLD